MVDPINYTGLQTQVNPGQALLGGLQTGAAISDVQFQNQQRDLALQQQQRQQADLMKLMNNPNPTAKDYADYTLRNPQQADAAKQAFGLLDEQRQKQTLGVASQVYSALQSGRQDLAQQILERQQEALGNGGNPGDAQANQTLLEVVKTDPNQALHMAGTFLASAMGPKNFASSFETLSKENRENALAPTQLAQAKANVEDTQSKIDTRAADLVIKRANTEIGSLNAQISKESNDIKREDLRAKRDAAQAKLDQAQLTKDQGAQSTLATLDTALDTVARLETHPGLSGNLGKTGVIPNIPGTDAADASALIDQLQSQTFLSSVKAMVGLGALSDAEGKQIANAAGSLNRKQSEEQFRRQLTSIKDIFTKNRDRISAAMSKPAAAHTGVILNHPVYGAITTERLDAAAKKNGVSRDELLKELQGAQ
tara:strand:+ start:5151 stop:6425 length:1275 start_codon:yes stop_codon:yes gene_type:complete